MKVIRLASAAAVAALCAAGTPAIADEPVFALLAHDDSAPTLVEEWTGTDEPMDMTPPTFNLALREWTGTVRFWHGARPLAERAIADAATSPLLVDDMIFVLAYGDGLASPPPKPLTALMLHVAARRLWAVVVHVMNNTLPRHDSI